MITKIVTFPLVLYPKSLITATTAMGRMCTDLIVCHLLFNYFLPYLNSVVQPFGYSFAKAHDIHILLKE